MTPDADPIPFSIITGFLGSGKTTILNALLADPRLGDVAVLINEFGQTGLDHLLVEKVDDDVVLLQSGCVCCSVKDDLRASIGSLLVRRDRGELPAFRHILLETTGVADPGPILQLLMTDRILCDRLAIHAVLTVVDGVYGLDSLNQQVEARRQAAFADRLIISKTDIAPPVAISNLIRRLTAINGAAEIMTSRQGRIDAGRLLSAPSGHRAAPPTDADGHHHDSRFSTFQVAWTAAVNLDDMIAWLEALLLARGDDILRLKGVVNVRGKEQPTVIQGVRHSLYPLSSLDRWPAGRRYSDLTFITQDFSRAAAIASLKPFVGSIDLMASDAP